MVKRAVVGAGALLLGVAAGAAAQDNAIGNPQLRNFQLPSRSAVPSLQLPPGQAPVQTAPVQAAPAQNRAPAPIVLTPPPPVTNATRQPLPAQSTAQNQPRPTAPRPAPAAPAAPPPTQNIPVEEAGAPPGANQAAPAPQAAPTVPVPAPATTPAPAPSSDSDIPWLYILPAALALAALAFWLGSRRRRSNEIHEAAVAAMADTTPAPPRRRATPPPAALPTAAPAPAADVPMAAAPAPTARPWLDLTLKAERAQATDAETKVQFELEIVNSGKAAARNLRIDVKMFNAGAEQDMEIGAFFRTAGRTTTKLNLPGIAADSSGLIRGEVAMAREEMRAVVLDDKYLFIPVIAVNALYEYGDGEIGQTSRSYVVGRELQQPSEKMGAFRVDQGPRVWRTVGQRQHSMAKTI